MEILLFLVIFFALLIILLLIIIVAIDILQSSMLEGIFNLRAKLKMKSSHFRFVVAGEEVGCDGNESISTSSSFSSNENILESNSLFVKFDINCKQVIKSTSFTIVPFPPQHGCVELIPMKHPPKHYSYLPPLRETLPCEREYAI